MSIFTYEKLYKAYLDCRKNKRKTINALKFEYDLEENLRKLLWELKSGQYRHGRSICFIVTEPKPREIFAADFRDRVVHHLFVRELLPFAEKRFIDCSFACRKGKGTHKAVQKIESFIKSAQNKKRELFYMQLDIKTFFPSIDQKILFDITENLIQKNSEDCQWREDMAALAKKIIFYDAGRDYFYKGDPKLRLLVPKEKSMIFRPEGKGLPIGNYTSQFFANLYLNEMDQFIKRKLRCRYYARYVDDFVIIAAKESDFNGIKLEISRFLKKFLQLELNNKKERIRPVRQGIDFLGYFIKEGHTLVRRSVVRRLRKKLFSPYKDREILLRSIASYFAHFKFANSWRLRSKFVEHQLKFIF